MYGISTYFNIMIIIMSNRVKHFMKLNELVKCIFLMNYLWFITQFEL